MYLPKQTIAQLISAKIILKNKDSNNIGNIIYHGDLLATQNVSEDLLKFFNLLMFNDKENLFSFLFRNLFNLNREDIQKKSFTLLKKKGFLPVYIKTE